VVLVNAAAESSTALPLTSLIVCSRNRPEMLADAVHGILGGAELPTELIIVDQSDRENAELAALGATGACDIIYDWNRTTGLSRALNRGIDRARYDVLGFTHDDVSIPPPWFGTLIRALLGAGERAVVTGRVLPEGGTTERGFVPSTKSDTEPAVFAGRVDAGVLYPMNMALHRSALAEVGPFDERLGPGTQFPAAEDNDLSFRLLEAGFSIHYVPDAVLHHRAWRSDREYLPLRWSYGRGQGAYYAKHMSFRDRYLLGRMGWEVQFRLRRLLRRLPREPLRSTGDIVYLAGLFSGMVQWMGMRHTAESRDAVTRTAKL
jgi:GT2 family glycosyltransferase